MNTDWIDEVLETMGEVYYPHHEYGDIYEETNKRSRKEAKARITAELEKAEVAARIDENNYWLSNRQRLEAEGLTGNELLIDSLQLKSRLEALKAQTLKEGDNEKN